MEMIEAMPPGLYEATITEVGENTENRELIDGKYLFRLETRTLDDIRAFGVNSRGGREAFRRGRARLRGQSRPLSDLR